MLAGMHSKGKEYRPFLRKKHQGVFSQRQSVSPIIDPPYGLRGSVIQIISVATDISPKRTNDSWDQDRRCRVQIRVPRQSEIIMGMKEAHPRCSKRRFGN
ncbi:hypothetical protein TNCV_1839091 [Trichonephila clavipes]|nr:hypothetical protein TNCV_1839091 [Trichonephila clavipes]